MVNQSVLSKGDSVLDVGAGEGEFLLQSIRHFTELGADVSTSLRQTYAVERNRGLYDLLVRNVRNEFGETSNNLVNADFFDLIPDGHGDIPKVDVVLGNPPYVGRHRIANFEKLRRQMKKMHPDVSLNGMTDLYGYFMVHASDFIHDGGRMALVVSESWLCADYGLPLKRFLLKKFRIKAIIGFRKTVFRNNLIRVVILFAERNDSSNLRKDTHVKFACLADDSRLASFDYATNQKDKLQIRNSVFVRQSDLDPGTSWSVYLRSPRAYQAISRHGSMIQLAELARAQIGLQTLREGFYILDAAEVKRKEYERRFFRQVIDSQVVQGRLAAKGVSKLVLFCRESKSELVGTKVLEHIEDAEGSEFPVRGHRAVVGLQNVPRIVSASRHPWYNLTREIDGRAKGSILIPRRFSNTYRALLNEKKQAATDDFIVVEPNQRGYLYPLLAILNSSITEFFLRVKGQAYGGGVCDLLPRHVKTLPVPDLGTLHPSVLQRLTRAYGVYRQSEGLNKIEIDRCIEAIVGSNKSLKDDLRHDSLLVSTLST